MRRFLASLPRFLSYRMAVTAAAGSSNSISCPTMQIPHDFRIRIASTLSPETPYVIIHHYRTRNPRILRTFRHKNVDGCGLGVRGRARVVAGVRVVRVAYGETALGAGARNRLHRDAASRRIIVDHVLVMVPEHVLGRCGALQH